MRSTTDKLKHTTCILCILRLSKHLISNNYHRVSRNDKVALPYQCTIGGCLLTRNIASYFSGR